MLEVGTIAPDIDARATDGRRFRLSENAGRVCTVIFFFPAAFTPGCTRETRRFAESYNELSLIGAAVLGISTDDHDTQCKFAESLDAPFPMIGDTDQKITRAYDVRWPIIGRAQRVTYVLDPTRRVLGAFRFELAINKIRDEVLLLVDKLQKRS
jgi:peroxiredoxin Q/BCP